MKKLINFAFQPKWLNAEGEPTNLIFQIAITVFNPVSIIAYILLGLLSGVGWDLCVYIAKWLMAILTLGIIQMPVCGMFLYKSTVLKLKSEEAGGEC